MPSGVGVIIDSSGHLGTVQSSARFKEAIKPMDKASEAILALKPVTFRYKQELAGAVDDIPAGINPHTVSRRSLVTPTFSVGLYGEDEASASPFSTPGIARTRKI